MTEDWDARDILDLLAAGDLVAAEDRCSGSCARHSDDAEAWFLLGAARHRHGSSEDALAAFARASALNPTDLRPRTATGALLAEAGRTAEALAVFEGALALQPQDPRLLTNAAIALETLGRDSEALARYDQALAAYPGMGDAIMNRTALLLRLGRPDAAMADAERLVALFPGLPAAHFNRAEVALALGRLHLALADCERAIVLDAGYAKAWIGKAIALAALGRLTAAQAALARAAMLDGAVLASFRNPYVGSVRGDGAGLDLRRIYVQAGWERQCVCDWHDRAAFVAETAVLVRASAGTSQALRDRALMFPLAMLPLDDNVRRLHASDVAAEVRRNARAESQGFAHAAAAGGRLRIGYLASSLREHPSSYLTRRLFQLHDRERYEVALYALRADHGPWQRRAAANCDSFRLLEDMSDAAAAARIHADGVQVLIDLSGYLAESRIEILAMRPAPVSVSYLGFPASLGPGVVDYRISDTIAVPDAGRAEFAEALVRLPHTHFVCDDEIAVPDCAMSRATAGLPASGFVAACFNNSYKIEPEVFAIWMRLLRALPDACLWLLDGPPGTVANLQRAAAEHGVEPRRLVFAPRIARDAHLQRLSLADLFLDTFTCNAHATACDALLAGLPVLTCPGQTMAARIGASLVTAAGLPELVAATAPEYEQTALRLGRAPHELATLRARLVRRQAPFFDTAARVRALERALSAMWARYREGLAPASFDVPTGA